MSAKIIGAIPTFLLCALALGAALGAMSRLLPRMTPAVRVEPIAHAGPGDRLFVLVHGMGGASEEIRQLAGELGKKGAVALVQYPTSKLSNADPLVIARDIDRRVQQVWAQRKYAQVVVVGYSMGALLSRKAFLYSVGGTRDSKARAAGDARWGDQVTRLVLIAGMNRGWDLSNEKPSDMRWYTYIWFSFGKWLANLTGRGKLVMSMEAGSSFVADLRLEWMNWFQTGKRPQEIVQLLGDIDELVSSDDDKDLRVTASEKFVWLKVRGSNHRGILEFAAADGLGAYRKDKVTRAVTQPFATLQAESEELPYETDPDVKKVVFIMHGIRDLGEWSSSFETVLRAKHGSDPGNKLAIASVRYGYFGMGQFLLRADRQKYVRWFMDQYTETLARYPQAREIDVIAHSNGTYLLANALQQYPAMKIRRAVLAGSVLPRDFDWSCIFERGQVTQVRNYVAADDWVVGFFPRLFETRLTKWMGNDIGSAGFNGFETAQSACAAMPAVDNVKFIFGQHSAFIKDERVDEIATYLSAAAPPAARRHPGGSWRPALGFASEWLPWLVYALIASLLVWIGSRVAGAAGERALVALVLYLALVINVLRWI